MMQWRELPDLALHTYGGSVIAASDETFAEKENLIRASEPVFSPHTFGHRGQVMDGWESRRRREPGHDWVIVRLGVPGLVRGVVVDTSWFTGNHPPECSVEAAYIDPLAPVDPLLDEQVAWTQAVARSALSGNTVNTFDVDHGLLVTHIRLRIYPDGGVARLRVHGEPVGDPRWLAGRSFDLAAMEHGARVADASNRFYSAPDNLLVPGPARVMGEGWETARRRDTGNDWVVVDLAAEGAPGQIEIDTTCFVGNAPDAARLSAFDRPREVLPRVTLQRDAVNRFLTGDDTPVRRLRLDIHPDGGLARFRAFGEPSAAGRAELFARWYDHLPEHAAIATMTGWGGADETWARALAAARPLGATPEAFAELADLAGRAADVTAWTALTGLGYG